MIIKYRDILVLLLFWIGFFTIGVIFYSDFNFYSQEGVFLLEKAQLAFRGSPPRLENISLVYPPLPFTFFLPFAFFSSPIFSILIATFWGAFCIAACVRYLRWVPGKIPFKIATTYFFFLNPIFLYLMFAEITLMIYASLLVIFVYLFFRFYETRIPYYIVLGGVVLGALTAVRYDTFVITMLLIPFVPFLISEPGGTLNFRRVFSLALMLSLPTLIVLGSWIYINWIFQGDPFHFLYSPYSYFKQTTKELTLYPELLDAKGNLLASIWVVLKFSFLAFPAYFVVLSVIRTIILFVAAIIPVIFQIVVIFLGLSAPSITWFGVLIPLSFIVVYYYLNSPYYNKIYAMVIIASMAFSLVVGYNTLSQSNKLLENNFAQVLIDRKVEDPFAQEIQVANYLKANCKEDQPILIDDAIGYPIVCFFNNPRQFYLPYQYDYFKFIQQPAFFSQYIVVPRPELTMTRFDQLTSIHPEAFNLGFNHTNLAFQTKNWRVYKSTVFNAPKNLKL